MIFRTKPLRAIKTIALLSILFGCFPLEARQTDMLITLQPVTDSFFDNAVKGADPAVNSSGDIIMIGTISDPNFAISDISRLALFDANGNRITITAERSSVYSEWDDGEINAVRIKAVIPASDAQQGGLRLSWGDSVSSDNQMADSFTIYEGNKDVYRQFDWQTQPAGDDASTYSATLNVIVDDKADTYYIWYLLPIAMIFIILLIRRFVYT